MLSRLNLLPYATDAYGAPYLHIHRADYHKILADEARRLGVDVRLGCTVTAIDFETPNVHVKEEPDFHLDSLGIRLSMRVVS